jgi:ABC-type transport system involved in cytochrome c biogenesis permease component
MPKGFTAIIYKDFALEKRSGTLLIPLLAQSILVVSILGLGVTTFIIDERTLRFLFHPLIWAILLLNASILVTRIIEVDFRAGLTAAFQVLQKPLWAYFLARWLTIFILLFISHVASSLILAMFLKVPIFSWLPSYLILSLLTISAYSAVAALLGSISARQSNRFILLPLISLPLLFPLFFAVLELSLSISIGTGLLGAGGWLSMIIALTAGYIVLGVLLIDNVVQE